MKRNPFIRSEHKLTPWLKGRKNVEGIGYGE